MHLRRGGLRQSGLGGSTRVSWLDDYNPAKPSLLLDSRGPRKTFLLAFAARACDFRPLARPWGLARTVLRSSLPSVVAVLAGPCFVDPASPFESAEGASSFEPTLASLARTPGTAPPHTAATHLPSRLRSSVAHFVRSLRCSSLARRTAACPSLSLGDGRRARALLNGRSPGGMKGRGARSGSRDRCETSSEARSLGLCERRLRGDEVASMVSGERSEPRTGRSREQARRGLSGRLRMVAREKSSTRRRAMVTRHDSLDGLG